MMAKSTNKPKRTVLEFEKPLLDLYDKLDELKEVSAEGSMNMSEEVRLMDKRIESMRKDIYAKLSPLQIIQVARHMQRPTTLDYIDHIFTDFIELHGDRNFSDDPAMISGIAKLDGRSVVIIGHQKGKTTKENIARNFGMARK